jgi:PAS domain S-box-containing protein
MTKRLKEILPLPEFGNEEEKQRATSLSVIHLVLFFSIILFASFFLVGANFILTISFGIVAVFTFLSWILLINGRLTIPATFATCITLIIATYTAYSTRGIFSVPIMAYGLAIIIASIGFGCRGIFITTLISIIASGFLVINATSNLSKPGLAPAGFEDFLVATVIIAATALILARNNESYRIILSRFMDTVSQEKTNREKFNQTTLDLEKLNNRLHTTLESISECLGFTDQKGNFLEVNNRFAALMGFGSPKTMTGVNMFSLFSEEDRAWARDNFSDETIYHRSIECQFQRRDGSQFTGELQCTPLTDLKMTIIGFVIYVREKTQQKQISQLNYESLIQQNLSLDSLPIPLMISRLLDGKVLYINQALADFVGVSKEGFILSGYTTDLFIDPEEYKLLLAEFQETGACNDIQILCKKHDSEETIWSDLSLRTFLANEETSVLLVFNENPSQKMTQDEVLVREKLESMVIDIVKQLLIVDSDDINQVLDQALQALGEFTQADRSYIYLIDHDNLTIRNTNKWCAPFIEFNNQINQAETLDNFPWLMKNLFTNNVILIDDLDKLPPEASNEKQEFERKDTRSFLILPLAFQSQLYGFLGFETVNVNKNWTEEDIRLLHFVADSISSVFARIKFEQQTRATLVDQRPIRYQVSQPDAQGTASADESKFNFSDRDEAEISYSSSISGNSLDVPIKIRGSEQLGTVSIEYDPPVPLSNEDRDFIEQVVDQVALALESARLFSQTQQALSETDTLYNIISDLNAARNYESILQVLSQRTILSGADQSLIMFAFDQPLGHTQYPEWAIPIAYQSNVNVTFAERYPISAFEAELGTLFTSKTVVLEDIAHDPLLDRITRALFEDAFYARSTIIVPLMLGDQSIGFIMANYGENKIFSDPEIKRLSTIANQVAIAVQGMQLLENTAARARREQLLRELTNQVNTAVGTDAILRQAAERVGKALKRPTFIYLGESSSQIHRSSKNNQKNGGNPDS